MMMKLITMILSSNYIYVDVYDDDEAGRVERTVPFSFDTLPLPRLLDTKLQSANEN